MIPAENDVTLPAALEGQPIERMTRDGVDYVILGTAHVSRASVQAVDALLETEHFDAVAVELCASRAHGIRDPEAFKQMDLFQVIRQGKAGMVAASLVLGGFQKRLAAQYGIEPGAEMKAAMDGAEARNLPVWLVDREVGTTLKRAWRSVGFFQRFGLMAGMLGSVFEREEIPEEDIEKLKQADLLESAFSDFAQGSAPLYRALIAERDEYMAARLRENGQRMDAAAPSRKVLVVIGAGHLKGMSRQLADQQGDARSTADDLAVTPPASHWPKIVAVGVVLAIFAAIGFAFYRSPSLGADAVKSWILLTGGLSALGALIAGGHPLSIIAAFIAGPLKPFRPGIPSGAFSAMAEAWVRKPRVLDFEHLRDDITHWTGWWKNRVARTLLNFFLVCVGTIAGEYIAGFHIIKSLL
ncbi:MAG: TraB/GumN family protein [Luteibacter sp.]|uniref:TraB/GumN family protein n=1 Tax=Rhodanobacteraceae TaxID=1775411 RepID=UPI00088C0088|nr:MULTISPECIES: TraB/GumN family protein [Rhodanobacteraceae]MDQ7995376.1 TraB/GumN family protein [Luteibacter sp.]MDQ8049014.1 TraB/GumN family protein [Luteibacter sp.]SDG85614.1 pheromone shutdown-related protein TraB [Dyella sp. 333MFSha]